MKPWILALTLAAFVAVGCGSDNKTSDTSTTTNGGSSTSSTGGGNAVALTGAGSTFVYPAMSKWTAAYQQANPGVTINYQPVGSGAGIGQLKAGTVDFAASDVAMSDKELSEMPGPVVQVPMISGCVTIAYNLPGIQSGLKLSGDVIADIYLGKITKWNDPRITGQNPGVNLPDTPISVAYRSDGSGTTYIFTDYLSTISPEWKAKPGKGKTIAWPVGSGQKGNAGVAGLVKQSVGGIGYIELAYAVQTKMTYAQVRNKSGKYVEATIDSTSAAANAAVDALKADIRTSIVDTSAPEGYPIAGFTYALVEKAPKDAAKGKAVVDFLNWVLGPGQDMAKELQYAPLPPSVVDLNKTALQAVGSK
ncbi:MAG TPA: phosphate ABC transporter substrate-binding protein PstS [Fimbriimonadaceae bacterium]|nr:phosphate ABC transporter substrate-binding protein PstS [Fimbriimonadaceae bacterium]